jgi:hypothetical protein
VERRLQLLLACAVTAAALFCSQAEAMRAASATASALYTGTVTTANNYVLKVSMHVQASGTVASVRFFCNGTTDLTSPTTHTNMAITGGAFSGKTEFGIWALSGHFTSATMAQAKLVVTGTCSTSKSSTYNLPLHLSSTVEASAPPAVGVSPTPGATYTVTKNTIEVIVKISASGSTATAAFTCDHATDPTSPIFNTTFPITNGTFDGKTQFDTYGIAGTFTSTSSAAATLHVQGNCKVPTAANYKVKLTSGS